jgi:hypothetical protein
MPDQLGVRVYTRTYLNVRYHVHFSFWPVNCLNCGNHRLDGFLVFCQGIVEGPA